MNYEIKNIDGGILDVDDKSRRVKVAISKIGVKDLDKDVIEATAYNRTIKERGPKGKGLIWHLTDHNPSLKTAVARFKELYMEDDFLVGVSDVPNTTWGNDILELYKTGNINQHSIGFRTVKYEVMHADDWEKRYTIIKEVQLFEGSAVLWGANEFTPTISVGKSLSKEDVKSEYQKTIDDLGTMHKMFKAGHLSDQAYELIEMKACQLSQKLQQLFEEATQPAQKAVEPDQDDLLDVLTTFTNNLKSADNDKRRIASTA